MKVYVEEGQKRVFACAVDWPGWCRSGKTEQAALELLAASAPRYALIARQAGAPFEPGPSFEVIERLPGSATTDFGAPDAITRGDRAELTGKAADRTATLLESSWKVFARAVASAPASLRKGPRGGGRDRDKIVEHVHEAEDLYARKVGIKVNYPVARRAAIIDAIRGTPPPVPDKGWPVRYFVRRTAWHVIDHLWEIEDRSEPGA